MTLKEVLDILISFSEGVRDAAVERIGPMRDRYEAFFSSAESHSPEARNPFRGKEYVSWNTELTAVAMPLAESLLGKPLVLRDSKWDRDNIAIDHVFAGFTDSLLEASGLSDDEKSDVWGKQRRIAASFQQAPERAEREAIRRCWKPIRILDGDYGEYDDITCYDEELRFFFELSPDDNYYHWGGYDMSPLKEEDVRSRSGFVLEEDWHEDPGPGIHYFGYPSAVFLGRMEGTSGMAPSVAELDIAGIALSPPVRKGTGGSTDMAKSASKPLKPVKREEWPPKDDKPAVRKAKLFLMRLFQVAIMAVLYAGFFILMNKREVGLALLSLAFGIFFTYGFTLTLKEGFVRKKR